MQDEATFDKTIIASVNIAAIRLLSDELKPRGEEIGIGVSVDRSPKCSNGNCSLTGSAAKLDMSSGCSPLAV